MDPLKNCTHSLKSHHRSRSSVNELLKPELEAENPEGQVPMLTNIKIIQTMFAGLVEHSSKEVKRWALANYHHIPWSLSQAKSAINKLVFLFHSHSNLEVNQRGLLKHGRPLQVINDEIWDLECAVMRQAKITGFFALKAPVDAVPVDKSSDDLPSLDDHNAAKSSSPPGEVSTKFVDWFFNC